MLQRLQELNCHLRKIVKYIKLITNLLSINQNLHNQRREQLKILPLELSQLQLRNLLSQLPQLSQNQKWLKLLRRWAATNLQKFQMFLMLWVCQDQSFLNTICHNQPTCQDLQCLLQSTISQNLLIWFRDLKCQIWELTKFQICLTEQKTSQDSILTKRWACLMDSSTDKSPVD